MAYVILAVLVLLTVWARILHSIATEANAQAQDWDMDLH
jgi:hypothetical protein